MIYGLTTTPPSVQKQTIDTYFTRNAEFVHPFVRTESWQINDDINSRALITAIYRWYKVLSPKIDLQVESVGMFNSLFIVVCAGWIGWMQLTDYIHPAFDIKNLLLYVSIHQVFRVIWIPFYKADVRLTTVLTLKQDTQTQLYYIQKQNDLYQTNQFLKFVAPFGGGVFMWVWQAISAVVCFIMSLIFMPVTWLEDGWGNKLRNDMSKQLKAL